MKMRWRARELEYIFATEFTLGFIIGYGLTVLYSSLLYGNYRELWVNYAVYAIIMSLYHKMEFYFVMNFHPDELSWSSYLIYHSREYSIAFLVSQMEFFLEWFLAPGLKETLNTATILLALPYAVSGLVLRNMAFYDARQNFHHLIRYGRDNTHRLVTTGIYSYDRHPAYLGYFLQTIGLQIILKNPITTIGFTLVLFRFFKARILEEEETLEAFFGQEYKDYRRRVKCHIPLVDQAVRQRFGTE